MIHDLRVVVVMPAYNAEHTIEKTWRGVIAQDVVDLVLVVDDASKDDTIGKAQELDNVVIHRHSKNRGYGANQKTCYRLALEHGPGFPACPMEPLKVPPVPQVLIA